MASCVVAVAAPLVAFGVSGGRLDLARLAPGLFAAIPAAFVELAVVWAWHAPLFHHAARSSAVGLVVEQASFAAAGLFVWIAALGGGTLRPGNRAGSGVVALLLTSMHMTLLGALLALAPRPLYHHGENLPRPIALDDQHIGGAIMLTVGGASYLIGGLLLSRRMLIASEARAVE